MLNPSGEIWSHRKERWVEEHIKQPSLPWIYFLFASHWWGAAQLQEAWVLLLLPLSCSCVLAKFIWHEWVTGLCFPPAPWSRNCSFPCSEDVSPAGLGTTGTLLVAPPWFSNGVEQLYSWSCAWYRPHAPCMCQPRVHGWTMPKAGIWLVPTYHLLLCSSWLCARGQKPCSSARSSFSFTTLKINWSCFDPTLMPGRFLWVRKVSWLSYPCVIRSLQGQGPDLVTWCYCLWQPTTALQTAEWKLQSIKLQNDAF